MSVKAIRAPSAAPLDGEMKVFTVRSGRDKYGLPIDFIQTIFRVGKITPVPLAPLEIVGLINLRGKINTATSLRLILGAPDEGKYEGALAICIERRGEQFALIVDGIGDVVTIPESARIQEPPNTERRRASFTSGVFRLKDEILPVLDVDVLLEFDRGQHRSASAHRQEGTSQ
jgi:purine-binding chemotaxis protein CheW